MQLPAPLISGSLIRRYKRFLADIRLEDGSMVTAHCADPGRLPGLAVEDAKAWLSRSNDPRRKLAYRLEIIEQEGARVAINTLNANRIAREALEAHTIPEFSGYDTVLREVRVEEGTRLDFAIARNETITRHIEVKSVSWKRDGIGAFPDAVTSRGTKHLRTLAELVRAGHPATLLFVAQRGDVERLTIAGDIDPDYRAAFDEARLAGVEFLAYACDVNEFEIKLRNKMELAV
ncbi:MAG: DNA/RNA nuclease SfsA [Geminicoccaceae bacterium]|nr:DNA/RNA nuclease SfsA [Geminicoccaceae bacterium]